MGGGGFLVAAEHDAADAERLERATAACEVGQRSAR